MFQKMLEKEILKLLIENREQKFSINEISKILNKDYKQTYTKIQNLVEKNIISVENYSNSKQCFFSNEFNDIVFNIEEEKKNKVLKNSHIKILFDRIKRVESPFFVLLIFGSYAKNTFSKNSDIDLCIISDSENISKKVEQIIKTLALNIHLINFNAKEFTELLLTKRDNVVTEILHNNIILFGVEDFYRILKNVNEPKNKRSRK